MEEGKSGGRGDSGKADSDVADEGLDADEAMTDEAQYEEAFAKMKKAAGVSDIDEVVRRFETQEETANHLQGKHKLFLPVPMSGFFSC